MSSRNISSLIRPPQIYMDHIKYFFWMCCTHRKLQSSLLCHTSQQSNSLHLFMELGTILFIISKGTRPSPWCHFLLCSCLISLHFITSLHKLCKWLSRILLLSTTLHKPLVSIERLKMADLFNKDEGKPSLKVSGLCKLALLRKYRLPLACPTAKTLEMRWSYNRHLLR